MDWNYAKVFLAVQRNESAQAAAVELKMSESTLFRQLNNLESELGKVFVRYGRNYTLTELGQDLLPIALKAEGAFNEIDRKIYGRDESDEGKVLLTAPTSFSYTYLPSIIGDLKEKYPRIQVELLVSNHSLNLSARQADIAIRVTDSPPEHFIGREIQEIGWSAYAGHGYIEEYGMPASIDELEKHRIIGATGKLQSNPAFLWLDEHLSSSVFFRVDDFIAMSHLAQSNQGVAILPDEFGSSRLRRLFPFENCEPNKLWILIHSDMRGVKRVSVVMQHLYESLREITF